MSEKEKIKDPLRKKWYDKTDATIQKVPTEEVGTINNTNRKHKEFIVNTTQAAIMIPNLGGRDVVLKVAGEDEFGGEFFNISDIPDRTLDTNLNYSFFLEKKFIRELNIEEQKLLRRKIESYRKQNESRNITEQRKIENYQRQNKKSRWEGEPQEESNIEQLEVDGRGALYDSDDPRNFI